MGTIFQTESLLLIALLCIVIVLLYFRMRSIRKMMDTEEDFRILFDQQPEAWIIFDGISLKALQANQKALNVFAIFRKNLLGNLKFSNLFMDPLSDDEVSLLLDAVDNQTFVNKRLYCKSINGRLLDLVVSINRVYEGNLFCRFTEPLHEVSSNDVFTITPPQTVSEDITKPVDKGIAETVHQKYESHYQEAVVPALPQHLVHVSNDAVVILNYDQEIIEANEAFARLTGYSIEALKEMGLSAIIHPGEMLRHESWWNSLKGDQHKVSRIERKILTKGGKTLPLEMLAANISSHKAVVITAIDNSVARAELEKLTYSYNNLQALINNSGEAIFSADGLGKIMVINQPCKEFFSDKIGVLLSESDRLDDYLNDDEKIDWKERFRNAMKGNTVRYRDRIRKNEIAYRDFDIFLYPVIDSEGLVKGITFFARDISDTIRQEDELLKARDEAENATRAKSEFLAVMSHEIRNPLNGLLGMADMLANTELNDEQKSFLDAIQISGEALQSVISDILDFSKIEANKMVLEEIPFSPRRVVQETISILGSRAKEKGIYLRSEFSEDVPEIVSGDKTRLRQVLLNLCSNAIKFTDRGGVSIFLRSTAEDNMILLSFTVKDTGAGISKEQQARLFKAFTQADSDTYRKYGGTGLGLSISRTIVELMGGTISVESESGEGSEFHFTVKVAKASASEKVKQTEIVSGTFPSSELGRNHPAKILLADDNDINRLLATRLLSRMGYQIETAADGHEAVEKVLKHHFDIVFMDVQMPEMDGFEATRTIIENLRDKQRPFIVAMTAFTSEEDKKACLDAGMNDYIAKPITIEDLERMIIKWSKRTSMKKAKEVITDGADPGERDDLLDQDAIRRLMDIGKQTDPGFLQQVLDMFMAQVPATIDEIRKSYDQSNYDKMWQAAHKLKGTCMNIGARKLAETCRLIENKGRALEIKGLETIVYQLDLNYKMTISELKSLFQYN